MIVVIILNRPLFLLLPWGANELMFNHNVSFGGSAREITYVSLGGGFRPRLIGGVMIEWNGGELCSHRETKRRIKNYRNTVLFLLCGLLIPYRLAVAVRRSHYNLISIYTKLTREDNMIPIFCLTVFKWTSHHALFELHSLSSRRTDECPGYRGLKQW